MHKSNGIASCIVSVSSLIQVLSSIVYIVYIHVVLRGTPGALGGPYHINHVNYGCSGLFLRRCTSEALHLKHIILFVDVTSSNNAVTSYMMSQCHICIGHVTVYYKRATSTLGGGVSVSSLVCWVQLSHPRPS